MPGLNRHARVLMALSRRRRRLETSADTELAFDALQREAAKIAPETDAVTPFDRLVGRLAETADEFEGNGDFYSERHLRRAIARITKQGTDQPHDRMHGVYGVIFKRDDAPVTVTLGSKTPMTGLYEKLTPNWSEVYLMHVKRGPRDVAEGIAVGMLPEPNTVAELAGMARAYDPVNVVVLNRACAYLQGILALDAPDRQKLAEHLARMAGNPLPGPESAGDPIVVADPGLPS